MANLKDFATGTVLTAPTPATSGTTLVLNSGEGAYMPATPFYATAHPPAVFPTVYNSEKVKVTNVSGDTLTIERGISGISAKSIEIGWRISNTLFKRDVAPIKVTVSTAAATAAKVGTSEDGSYVPEVGDLLEVTFSSGCNVSTPTLSIDGDGAKNIRLGNINVTTAFVGTTSALVLRMWYDGTGYQIFGSLKNDNTTYTEISDAESITTSSSTARLVSGRRLEYFKNNSLRVDEDDFASNTDVKFPTQQSVKAYVDAAIASAVSSTKQALFPIGAIYVSAVSTNPATLLGFGTWVADSVGAAIVGKAASGTFETAGSTMGAETHTLTTAEMPSHSHQNPVPGGSGSTRYPLNQLGATTAWHWDSSGGTEATGGGGAHNNIQPSKVFYVWRRTA